MTTFLQTSAGTRVAPLGLRFWDPVTRSFVGEGLSVTACLESHRRLVVASTVNSSGAWTFHHLPGADDLERALLPGETAPRKVDDAFWSNPALGADKRSYLVRAEDIAGRSDVGPGVDARSKTERIQNERTRGRRRFLPVELPLLAPVRDLVAWSVPGTTGFPAGPGGAIPLFSSPARAPLTGMAAVRLELSTPPVAPGAEPVPAAWALVRASLGATVLGWGLSDEAGRALLLFPYPGAPSGMGSVPLPDRTWDITLAVWYSAPPPGALPSPRAVFPAVFQQTAKSLRKKWGPTPADRTALGTVKLRFGEELIVKSDDGQGRTWVA